MENQQFHLRYATPADNVLLADLGAQTFADSFAADNRPEDMAAYLAASFSPEQQALELADSAATFLIIEVDGTAVGYAQLHLGAAPAAIAAHKPLEIVRLYARKEWIGKGVGARLMQACLDEAVQTGCDIVWLGVWERNPRAIAFYREWGFEQVGAQTGSTTRNRGVRRTGRKTDRRTGEPTGPCDALHCLPCYFVVLPPDLPTRRGSTKGLAHGATRSHGT